MTVINTPEGITHFQMGRIIAALKIEVKTGMKGRGSTINYCRDVYGTTKRTKKGVLAEMLTLYKDTYGRDYGSSEGQR